MSRSFSLIAAAALSLAASLAHANSVKITGFTADMYEDLSVGGKSMSAWSGQLTGTLDGASFKTYCVDLYQFATVNTTYTDYSVVSGVTAFGAQKSNDLDHLLSYLAKNYDTSNAMQSAIAQAAVWEVVYETGSSYDLTKGNFSMVANAAYGTAMVNTFATTASAFDWKAVASTAVTLHADKLFSPNEQDFIRVTAVPEPSTYAMLAGGLGALGFVARRRKPNA